MADLSKVHTNPKALARTRERIAITTEAARRAGNLIAHAGHRPVFPAAEAIAAANAFHRPLQDQPRTAHDVIAELDNLGSPATTVTTGGRYFGFVTGGVLPAAHGAAILATTWDNNAFPPSSAPAVSIISETAGEWIRELLNLPTGTQVAFCAGATVANLTAIITARDTLLERAGWDVASRGLTGAPQIKVIVGAEAHASVMKSLRLAGFGTDYIRVVPTDARGAIDANAFPTDADNLTLTVLQAGNVNTGASDPFTEILPKAQRGGGWVHIDGAFGLWAAAAPSLRHLTEGAQAADSWATDGHKWLNVPYDSGILAVRDADALKRAMRADAAYLSGATSPAAVGIQMSQRARGVEAWAALASLGRAGLAQLLEQHVAQAQRFADRLTAAGVELLAPVELNQALVGFGAEPHGPADDEITRRVIAAVQAGGVCWPGGTVWQGRAAMRISVSDAATTNDDVDAAADAILEAWYSVRKDFS